jgi:hypothetical protein
LHVGPPFDGGAGGVPNDARAQPAMTAIASISTSWPR